MTAYYVENRKLWAKLHRAARMLNTDMNGLDRLLCLADGTLDVMETYGIVPEGELLTRLVRFLGITGREAVFGEEALPVLEVQRAIPVYGSLSSEHLAMGQMFIDRDGDDFREYIGLRISDESMSRAGIISGDVVVFRRQAVAEDGDIVAAEAGGTTVVRRYHRRGDISWLEAEGYVGSEPDVHGFAGDSERPSVKIWGKVVYAARDYEKK